MAWSNHILTYPIVKIGTSGDLQQALHRPLVHKQLLLVADLQEDQQGNLSDANAILPMAAFKPFRDNSVLFFNGAAQEAARKATRYGFGNVLPLLSWTNNAVSDSVYQYQKPIPGQHPLRPWDFFDNEHRTQYGYTDIAKAPLEVLIGNHETDIFSDGTMVQVRLDDQAYYDDDDPINENVNITVEKFLTPGQGLTDYSSYHLTLLLWFRDRNRYCAVVTKYTMAQLRTQLYNWAYILLKGPADLGSGYPGIPLLENGNYSGDNITIIACMSNLSVAVGKEYSVYNDTDSGWSVNSLMSLAFTLGADRVTGQFNAAGSDWSHLSSTLAISHSALGQPDQSGYYHVSLGAVLSIVADSGWSGNAFNLHLSIEDRNGSVLEFDDGTHQYDGPGPVYIPFETNEQYPFQNPINKLVRAGNTGTVDFSEYGLNDLTLLIYEDLDVARFTIKVDAWRSNDYAHRVTLANQTLEIQLP
jgi:hypothetical protein